MKKFCVILLLLLLGACVPTVIVITPTPFIPTETPTITITSNPTNTATVRPSVTPTTRPSNTPTPTQLPNQRMRISYNINGYSIPDRQYLIQHLQVLQPTTVLVMDDLVFTGELARQLPNTIVIYRGYSAHEGSEWNYKTPQQFVDRWLADRNFLNTHGYQNQRNIVFYSTNEPSFGGAFSVEQFVTHMVETMRLARQNGLTIVAGNYATGMIHPDWITSGKFDPYIRALQIYQHYHGAHEYTTATLAFGVGQMPIQCLDSLAPQCVQPSNWATRAQIPVSYFNSTGLPPYWHLRRNDWFILRADTIGATRPRIILTECCHDHMNDIDIVLRPLESRFGMPQYHNDLRGINSHRRLWEFYYPHWTFAQAIYNQLVWADYMYPPEYIGYNLFTWSRNELWLQTDYSGLENPDLYNLHRMLEEYARKIRN